MTLTRLDPTRVALAAGVPQRLAVTIRQALTTRLGGTMSNTDAGEAAKTEDGAAAGLSRTVIWAALAILAAFAGLVAYMLISASASEQVWQRQMYVFASVEAIVFAAAGALFGVEVKRQEAAKAVQVADRAVEEAEEAKKSERQASEEAERGRTLAATARGLAATPAGTDARGPDVPGARGGPSSTSQQDVLRALAHVANELFPPGK